MPGLYTAPPHRVKGSWTPRLAGVVVVVVVVGGSLAVYLGTAKSKQALSIRHHHHSSGLSVKVASAQTVGLIDFGPYDDGDAWQSDSDYDHPMMLIQRGATLDFVRVPESEVNSGTPEWTADQMTDGGEIFIYVPSDKCLTSTQAGQIQLTHCDLGMAQRWRPVHSQVVLSEPIAQYANVATGGCLTAGREQGQAKLTPCGLPHTRNQEIAFWWSA
jgi:hypothetical protein